MIQITIPIEPKTKKNHQRIIKNKRTGAYMVIPSEQYKKYEKESVEYLEPLGIDYPVNVEGKFYMGTRRRVDLNNLLEALTDVLVKGKVVIDDNSKIIAGHDGSRVLYDKENPRTEVRIWAI